MNGQKQNTTFVQTPRPLADTDAERAVLASLLLDVSTILDVVGKLHPDEFYTLEYRETYTAMLALQERGENIDFITLASELNKRRPGGDAATFLAELVTAVPSAIYLDTYAATVREMAQRRRLVGLCTETAKEAYQLTVPMVEIEAHLLSRVLDFSADGQTQHLQHVSEVLDELWDHFAPQNDAERPLFPTGYCALDAMLGGFRRGSLILVGARTGEGKTALCLNLATKAARAGRSVLLFSLEMTAESVGERLLAAESNVSLVRLSGRTLLDDDYLALSTVVGGLAELPIWIDDTPAIAMPEMMARVQRFMLKHPLDLVIVDYLQLARAGKSTEKRYLEVGFIAQELKRLARTCGLPVLAACQLSRAPEQRDDKTPLLSDLRESGNLEQDADAVLFIHTLEHHGASMRPVDLVLAKNRFGPTGRISLLWDGPRVSFVEPDPSKVRHG